MRTCVPEEAIPDCCHSSVSFAVTLITFVVFMLLGGSGAVGWYVHRSYNLCPYMVITAL